ncbi:hypothetical protein [Streptomyces decoyicus]|uniref:hypothetical protein n=1 Tax=Streptomyces decoyicus TaxID=249567 RepID=UPI001ADFA2E4|nr:hypothetical protein [Streptomyces decoyicus]QZY14133.1 hypothetical protein K7C20_01775 [Streptomyces decoyicus]
MTSPMTMASPLISPAEAAAYGDLPSPAPHSDAELAALLALLTAPGTRIATVVVGHSRDAASRSSAAAFAEAWRALGRLPVLAVVDWPESAASWLRAANRFTAEAPDAWVVAAAPLGWAQMSRRLRHSTDWDPARTYGFAALGDSRGPALAGQTTLHGMRGVTADGGIWTVDRSWVTQQLPARRPTARPRGTL